MISKIQLCRHCSLFSLCLLVALIFQPVMQCLAGVKPGIPVHRAKTAPTGTPVSPLAQTGLKIVGPSGQEIPVVNERKDLQLKVINSVGQPVQATNWASDSTDVARIDPNSGKITGVTTGFATISAQTSQGQVQVIAAVARIKNQNKSTKVSGDSTLDTQNNYYLSDPRTDVIFQAAIGNSAGPQVYAGSLNSPGFQDGSSTSAKFNNPLGLAFDNRPNGGLFVADSTNHCVRKIDGHRRVTRVIGAAGTPGQMTGDDISFDQMRFNSPSGVAIAGGNLLITDTVNHAIWYLDFQKQRVNLFAGQPGIPGKLDGRGRAAQLNRPTGISINSEGTFLAVADAGNNAVRLMKVVSENGRLVGEVTTIGKISSARDVDIAESRFSDRAESALVFDNPQTVSIDDLGNITVVEENGAVSVALRPGGREPLKIELAQAGTFIEAANATNSRFQTYVTDLGAPTEADILKIVEFGPPQITSLSQESDQLAGGAEVVITGKNFSPESRVILGESIISNPVIDSATRIRFTVPPQTAPGTRTLSVVTRGGVAQRTFFVQPPSLSQLGNSEITTIAGGIPFSGDGGLATNASLSEPEKLVFDGQGNLYIADWKKGRIRKIDPSGIITTVAGNGITGFSNDGMPAISASLNQPRGVAIDAFGDIYIADTGNRRIRKVELTTGTIKTVAGNGKSSCTCQEGVPALQAGLNSPTDVAVDGNGNIYICDQGFNRIRKVDSQTGLISTVAGTGQYGFGGDNGSAQSALLFFPTGINLDSKGNLFIADYGNNRIRRVDKFTNIITTIAGNGRREFEGDGGPAVNAAMREPAQVAIDADDNLFIADSNNFCIRKVDAVTRQIRTIAGIPGGFFFSGDGGPATQAYFRVPKGVAVDANRNIVIADSFNNRIRRVSSQTGMITTIAGSDSGMLIRDGFPAQSASLLIPFNVTFDRSGNYYICDCGNNRIRKVQASTQTISTIAGTGIASFGGDGGPALAADLDLQYPGGVVVDNTNNLYVSIVRYGRIRKINLADDTISHFAGCSDDSCGDAVQDGYSALNSRLQFRIGNTAVDPQGNLHFVEETNSHRVRRIDAGTKIITTVAGDGYGFIPPDQGGPGRYNGDGIPARSASLNFPAGIAFDTSGNLYIADTHNYRIRKVDVRTGIISTVAGNGTPGFSGDNGLATNAQIGYAASIAVDSNGTIFFADNSNQRIRRVDPVTKIITTIAGNGTTGYSGDGGPALNASFNLYPFGTITLDRSGNLLIADTQNNAIRMIKNINAPQPATPQITNAIYASKILTLTGSSFGPFDARVFINGVDVTLNLRSQNDSQLTLKGSRKKLNLQTGDNRILVMAGGQSSNVYILRL